MAATGSAKTRLYVDDDLGDGRKVDLSASQAHYLKHVLRLSASDCVVLFNGRDGEWLSRIDAIGRGCGSLEITFQLRAQSEEPDLWLLFAPIKRARLDFLVQKAVELGVSRIIPVTTDRTEVRRLNVERHRTNVIEATEQCERMTLPSFAEPQSLAAILNSFPEDRTLAVCAERGDAPMLGDVLRAPEAAMQRWAILCGPEGGFTERELDALRKLPFISLVSLGPRILRAETAVLSAVTCWQAELGDWRQRPPERDLA